MTPPLLELRDVDKRFRGRRGHLVTACHEVSLAVQAREVVGLVGESGSGKSTVANLALGLVEPDAGEVLVSGERLTSASRRRQKELRAQLQAVFQEPLLALDGRRTIAWSIAEPLRIHGRGTAAEQRARVAELLRVVGLDPSFAERRPSQLSGGQLQRVNIARAIALSPALLVCDEPVSALDVSVQAQIINLFLQVQSELGVGMLFISHDLAVVRHLADRIVVMYAGHVVEEGPAEAVCREPHHPYTRALLDACLEPVVDERRLGAAARSGATSAPERVPDRGCPFVPRCPLAQPECAASDIPLTETTPGRRSACRRAELLVAERPAATVSHRR
jgi:oligopeptide/dipeptide ABC transporter ATP-binding protein